MRGGWDRQRVLALVWLVGSGLTALTLVLPYEADLATAPRAVVAAAALVTALALWRGPQLSLTLLHLIVAAGTCLVAYCTHLGVPDVEAVMFLLPIVYASATFPAREAAPHVVLAVFLLGVVLLTAPEAMTVAPWIAFALVAGVGTILSFVLAQIVDVRERERVSAERDRRIAGELQRTLLPERLPAVDGALLAARYLPAAREADVGGDLYDAFRLRDGRLALVVGDVAGKGLAAAQMVGGLRHALRAYALEDTDVGAVLSRVDRYADALGTPDAMATMLLVALDPATGDVEWASAGHPPPLLLRPDNAPAYLDGAPGAPLSVEGDEARARVHRAALREGESLLLFTDGLIERRGEALDTGMRRLAAAALAAGGVPLPVLLDALLPVAPRPLQDDVTALVVRRTPREQPELAAATSVVATATRPVTA